MREHYWARESRWGPPTHVERGYTFSREMRGREEELHRSMREHADQRREVQRRGYGGDRR